MLLSILHRMILWELIKVFVISLVGITGLLLMGGIVAEASQQGLGPAQILAIIPLLIPSTLPYTLPTTTLFATCVVYGRLAHDNEILAIKAAGVNITKVMVPAILLGLVMSAVTMTLYYRIIPHTHGMMRTMFLQDIEEVLYTMLKREGKIAHPQLPYAIYVQAVHGHKLVGAWLKRGQNGRWDVIAQAREAELHVDMEKNLVKVHMIDVQVTGDGELSGSFKDKEWEVPLPASLNNTYPSKPRDQSWQELLINQDKLAKHLEDTWETLRKYQQSPPVGLSADDLAKRLSEFQNQCNYLVNEMRYIGAELLLRPALSCGCLCFVLVGCPVGIWLSRSDYLSSFITCFLPIVFVYYPLILCGTKMAGQGKFHPALCIWAADGVMAVSAMILSWRLTKH